ncbi:MAG: hypothetical protein U0R78_19645 [Nocardioidaceae bacterium]
MTARAEASVAAVFAAAVGRPKRRRSATRAEADRVMPVWVTRRPAIGRSLVRGASVVEVLAYAGLRDAPWSVSAGGFVLDDETLADALAAASRLRAGARFRDLDEDGTLSEWRRSADHGDLVDVGHGDLLDDGQLVLFGGEVE